MTQDRERQPAAARTASIAGVAISLVLLWTCSDDSTNPTPDAPVVASVSVTPAEATVEIGSTVQVSAVVVNTRGETVSRQVTWSTSAAAVANVSPSGLVTGVREGSATVTATVEGKSAATSVTVTPPVVASVQVLGVPDLHLKGNSAKLSARVLGPTGTELPGLPIIWSSSDPTIAQISATGVLTAVSYGRATINAAVYDVSGEADLLVAEPPPAVSLGPWTPIGPTNIPGHLQAPQSGKLQAIARSPSNTSRLYVAGGLGSGNQGPWTEPGVWRTDNGGATWTFVSDGLTDRVIDAIWVDPVDPDLVLVGTDRHGIFRSVNGGASWTRVYADGPVSELLWTGGELIAGGRNGILRSMDRGATWTLEQATVAPVRVLDMGAGAAVAGLDNGTLLRKEAANQPWVEIAVHPNSTVWSVAAHPTDADILLAIIASAVPPRIRRSTDGGETWSDIPGFAAQVQVVRFVPGSSTLLIAQNGAIFRSADLGDTRTQLPDAYWDIRAVNVEDDGTILLGTDQGVHQSTDGGSSWDHLTGTTHTAIIYGLSVLDQTILTSPQDFSPIVSFDGGMTWDHPSATSPGTAPWGENGQLLINPILPQYCYAMTTGGFQTSSDHCHTWTLRSLGGFPYVQPGYKDIIAVDPTEPSRVYFATPRGLIRSENHGVTVTTVGSFADATGIAVHPTDPDILLLGTTAGLYRSENRGASWTGPIALAGAGYPTSMTFHPTQPDLVFVTTKFLPSLGGGALRSLDGGRTFSPVMNGIDRPFAGVLFDSSPALSISETGVVAFATLDGVYLSDDLGATWRDITPAGITFFGDVDWDGGALYGATAGSGVLKAVIRQ